MTESQIILKLREVYKELVQRFPDLECTFLRISFSGRFKTRAGDCTQRPFNTYEIRLSRELLKQFGYDRIEQTFRHELAHVYCFKKNSKGHNGLFKSICSQFGGSMNTKMAGWRYSETATTEYVKSTREFKYEYTCTKCGNSAKYRKRMSSKVRNNKNRVCSKCRTPIANFTETRL